MFYEFILIILGIQRPAYDWIFKFEINKTY